MEKLIGMRVCIGLIFINSADINIVCHLSCMKKSGQLKATIEYHYVAVKLED